MAYLNLFQPGNIGTCNLRNRIIMPLYPTKYSQDSRVNERMLAFYRERARGGAAMIVLDCPCLDYAALYKGKNELRIDEKIPEPGKHIVILGGGEIGCETADMLSAENREITVIEILPAVVSKMKDIPREDLLRRLKEKKVKILTETEAVSIEQGKAQIKDKEGNRSFLQADSVIVSIGTVPENSLLPSLKEKVPEIYVTGDAAEPGNVGNALRSAAKAALEI